MPVLRAVVKESRRKAMDQNNSLEIGDKFTIEGQPLTYTVTKIVTGPPKLTAYEKEEMERYLNWTGDGIDIEAFIHSWGRKEERRG